MCILWVRYWPIHAVQSMCLPGLVDICVCLFNQKWLGTPVVEQWSRTLSAMVMLYAVEFSLVIKFLHSPIDPQH